MPDFGSTFLTSLGAFAPCAALGWWIIRNQSNVIKAKDLRIEALTAIIIETVTNDAKTATELTLAVRALKTGGN